MGYLGWLLSGVLIIVLLNRHLSAGFLWNSLERPDDIQKLGSGGDPGCSAWSAWTSDHVVDQIDVSIPLPMPLEREVCVLTTVL
jgi:hypothetical protein